MSARVAFLTGITGQDGSYLAAYLLDKGYAVHGLVRPAALQDPAYGLRHLQGVMTGPHAGRLRLHAGDLCDPSAMTHLLRAIRPDEVYNLAAQSHVHRSFELPDYTAQVNGLGVLRLLESMRAADLLGTARFYQASTSELFGDTASDTLNESSPLTPCSPYATAKLFAFWTVAHYRRAYGLFACNGILFNHESARRPAAFVTRKVSRAAAAAGLGLLTEPLRLGDLHTVRDWGFAPEYVESMWRMLQGAAPDDFVIATGEGKTPKDFADAAFARVGLPLRWRGDGPTARATSDAAPDPSASLIVIDPALFRPAEPRRLVGDASRARRVLGWRPQTDFKALVAHMVDHDLQALRAEAR
jgi:GDPmannose 4,6-dehydratase